MAGARGGGSGGGGGGGDGGENVIVFDSSVPAAGNVYSTLAAAVTAVMLLKGDRILRIVDGGTHTFPTGTFDCFQLHILADRVVEYGAPARNISFPEGVVFTRVPKAIRGFNLIQFTNTTVPLYSGNGADFDLELETGVEGGTCRSTSTGHAFVINDTANDRVSRLAIYGATDLRRVSTGSVLRLENLSTLILELHDLADVSQNVGTYPFSDDGLANNYCEARVIGTGATFSCPTTTDGLGSIMDQYLGASGREGLVNVNPAFLGRLADDTGQTGNIPGGVSYGGLVSYALRNTGVSTAVQLVHPIIAFMAMHGRGSIMPSGITGNALLADGIMGGGLTSSAIATALNLGTNIRRIEAMVSTGAVLGDEAGWQTTDTVCARGLNARILIGFRLPLATLERFFIGVSGLATRADNSSADTPAGASMAGIQFSTDRGDTQMQFMVQSAGTQTRQANVVAGLPVATFQYVLEIVFTGLTSGTAIGVYMRLFRHANTVVSELGSHSFTVTQSPPGGTPLRVVASIQTRTAAIRQLATHAVNISTGI